MLAVHGTWSDRLGLIVWGEDTTKTVKSRSQATRSARPHPFAAAIDTRISGGRPGATLMLLPSLLSAPLDSPELVRVRPRPRPRHSPTLLCWEVPVVTWTAPEAFDLLEGLRNDAPTFEDVRCGESIEYLSHIADFAFDLVGRGRVLPTVEADERGHTARWRAVLQGPDAVAFQSFATAMPPICRAAVDDPSDRTGTVPNTLVTSMLHAFVDAAVRERLGSKGVSPLDAVRRRGRRPKRLPAAEAWLGALSSTEPRFDADDVDELERSLDAWSDFGTGRIGPARAVFRLDDNPEEANAPDDAPETIDHRPDDAAGRSTWFLEFWLQSVEDPSLMVPADQVWAGGHGLDRWLQRPDELLLAELGRAASVYPALADAMHQSRPAGLALDATKAYDFLARFADPLDQAGFAVLVPSWWSKRRSVGLSASAQPQDGGVAEGAFTKESLCTFEWRLAVGDVPLTDDELAALAATKEPLVRLRGEWVAVDPEQIKRGIEFIRRQGEQTTSVADVISLAATDPDDTDLPLEVTDVRAGGLLGDLLSGAAEHVLEPIDPPDGFRATLRPYQRRGLSWLTFLFRLGLGACLADDMGLGKTIQLLALETHLRREQSQSEPTLLLCPMSLIGNWQREADKFAPWLRIYVHHGSDRLHDADLDDRLAGSDLVLTTYHTVARDIDELSERSWERVVADEAQAIKNDRSRTARAARRLEAESRIALTGTPMENRLAELWSVMDFLNPGILGTREAFRTRFATPIERNGQTAPAERLRAITRPYILRRLKTDSSIVDDLPEKIEIKQYCNLTIEQASLYQSVVAEMMPKIEQADGIERRGNVLATMTKLKQVCNHPAQLLHDGSGIGARSGKVARLHEILNEIVAEGDKVLLFTQFTEFADMLLPHLSAYFGRDVAYLHGKSTKKHRDEMVEQFQSATDGPSIFLLSLKAGGTGLNLAAGNHVIHLDRWWNPAVEDQATDRAFRIGQKRNVEVHKFICTGTLEEKIDEMIEKKKEIADLVVGDGEGWLSELSTRELKRMFTLSEGAVGE